MVKIGVISDTHLQSADGLPKQLLQALADTEMILHAGDLVNLAVLEGLKRINPNVKAVCGNMDQANVKQALVDKEIIQVNNLRIGLTHGWGAPFHLMQTVREKFKHDFVDCIVYGHSHTPRNETRQGILYFNPGSPTDRFFAPYNSYGVLEIDNIISGKIIKLTS